MFTGLQQNALFSLMTKNIRMKGIFSISHVEEQQLHKPFRRGQHCLLMRALIDLGQISNLAENEAYVLVFKNDEQWNEAFNVSNFKDYVYYKTILRYWNGSKIWEIIENKSNCVLELIFWHQT